MIIDVVNGSNTIDGVGRSVAKEIEYARAHHSSVRNLHEAYGVIAEEFREFEIEVFKNASKHPNRNSRAREELIQIAAMCFRAIVDLDLQPEEVLKTSCGH